MSRWTVETTSVVCRNIGAVWYPISGLEQKRLNKGGVCTHAGTWTRTCVVEGKVMLGSRVVSLHMKGMLSSICCLGESGPGRDSVSRTNLVAQVRFKNINMTIQEMTQIALCP